MDDAHVWSSVPREECVPEGRLRWKCKYCGVIESSYVEMDPVCVGQELPQLCLVSE